MNEKTKEWGEFIRIWQASSAVLDVSRKTKKSIITCRSIANYMRANGVPLQKFKKKHVIDWPVLIQLAKTLAAKPEASA